MGNTPTIYAHSLPGRPKSQWETLETHAGELARLARSFAAAFGAGDWGELLGLWHDLGKRSAEFQRYICKGDPDVGEEESAWGRVERPPIIDATIHYMQMRSEKGERLD